MILPRSKLLLWLGLIVVPFSLLQAVEPATTMLCLLVIGGFAAVALTDGLRAPARLAGLSVALPEVARMSKDREAKLEVRIHNPRQSRRNLRLALGLPSEIECRQEEQSVSLPPNTPWSRFAWDCLPRKRGSYTVAAAYLETGSPWGLWSARKTVPTKAEIRVYPNLSKERRQLSALFLQRGSFGLHAQRQVGKGREFEKLREYNAGDSFDEIHWKATARRGRPITKVFQLERTQEVYVILDASRLSAREMAIPSNKVSARNGVGKVDGAGSQTTLERFVTAALVLGLAAEQQGDLFGVLTFTNNVGTFLRARNGKAHYSACRDALYTLQPETVTPDFDELCTFIRLRLRRRALLVFLTALDDPVLAESFVRNVDLIRRQHLVLVNMLQAPGVAPLFTNSNLRSLDEIYQQLGGHLLWHQLRELEKTLERRGVQFALLKNERLSADLVSQYINVKHRQLI